MFQFYWKILFKDSKFLEERSRRICYNDLHVCEQVVQRKNCVEACSKLEVCLSQKYAVSESHFGQIADVVDIERSLSAFLSTIFIGDVGSPLVFFTFIPLMALKNSQLLHKNPKTDLFPSFFFPTANIELHFGQNFIYYLHRSERQTLQMPQ